MNDHSLVEVTNMLHWVRSVVVHGEHLLIKLSRKFSTFNPTGKR